MRRTDPYTEVWIIMVTSSNSSIKVMLKQENDPELDDGWLNANRRLTRFRKYRKRIVGSIIGSEYTSIKGPQTSEEDLVV